MDHGRIVETGAAGGDRRAPQSAIGKALVACNAEACCIRARECR